MLVFWFLVRNSVVLAVYLLFSVACFFTAHEHYDMDSLWIKAAKHGNININIAGAVKRCVHCMQEKTVWVS
jgi:hypothetical protein